MRSIPRIAKCLQLHKCYTYTRSEGILQFHEVEIRTIYERIMELFFNLLKEFQGIYEIQVFQHMSCTKTKLLGWFLKVLYNCKLSLNSAGNHKVRVLLILGTNGGSLDSLW